MTELIDELCWCINTFDVANYVTSKQKYNYAIKNIFLFYISKKSIIKKRLLLSKSMPFRRFPLPEWYMKETLNLSDSLTQVEIINIFQNLTLGISLYDLVINNEYIAS